MQNRRETLKQSLAVAGLLGGTGLFPQYALAFNRTAFEAKSVADAVKAYGGGAPFSAMSGAVSVTSLLSTGAPPP